MAANTGKRVAPAGGRGTRARSDKPLVAWTIRIEDELHDKIIESAQRNGRSRASEVEYQLRQIYS